MARPASRSRRGRRDEEEDEGATRRGRGAPRARTGPSPIALLGGAVGVLAVIIVVVIVASAKPKEVVAPTLPPPPPPAKKEPPPPTAPPPRPEPKPLTLAEKEELEAVFREAEPHIEQFRKHVAAGWERKKKEDNDGANECWIDAKHEFQKAVQIVSALLEDETRFAPDRPGLERFNARLGAWQREMADLPKVNMTR